MIPNRYQITEFSLRSKRKTRTMSNYYCHNCALVVLGFVKPISFSSLSATSYQLGKFIEHTAPSSSAFPKPINSVFDDPTYSSYKNHIVCTAASGWVERDSQGRFNMAWYAGSKTGVTYRKGSFHAPADGVKLVLPHDVPRLHAYPIESSSLSTVTCLNCGAKVPH